MMNPTVSILIVNYKMNSDLEVCRASLDKWTQPIYELLIGDNSPPLKNEGFARKVNRLLKAARGQYIIILNPDTVVTEGWLDQLLRAADSSPNIGIVQPKTLRLDGRLDSTGHQWNGWFQIPGNRGEEEKDNGQYDSSTELLSCDFCAVLIKRKVFEQIGCLDGRFFLYHEDIDFCFRARKAGWRVIYCPQSVVWHKRHGSGPPPRSKSWGRLIWKWRGLGPYAEFQRSNLLGMIWGLRSRNLDLAFERGWHLFHP